MLRPATRRFLLENLRATGSLLSTLHGYLYLRWPVWYIRSLRGKPVNTPTDATVGKKCRSLFPKKWTATWSAGLGKWFSNGYHGKVMPPDTATRLIQIDKPLDMPLPESVLPYPEARRILLNENDAVALFDCPCRLSRPTHCEPVDVCILVGDTVVEFALAHHPDHARRVTPAEAVDVIRRCNERGLVTHAFFKSAVLDRFYAICNCCTCCCGAMQGHFHGVPMLAASGYVAKTAPNTCVGCGKCARRCPFAAITMQGNLPCIDPAKCMGCGLCVLCCPCEALSLQAQGTLKPLVL